MSFHPAMGTRPKQLVANQVAIVLPGLVWSGQGIASTLAALELPALRALLGRGRTDRSAGQAWLQYLAREWRCEQPDWAALRFAGEQQAAPETAGHILCADPVSLAFSSDAMILRGPRELALNQQEAEQIVDLLNREFGDAGRWTCASPTRFYLLAERPLQTRFHPLDDVFGRPVAYFPPEGEGARNCARLSNDIQIALHNAPLTRQRQELGQLNANGIWLWGQADGQASRPVAPCTHVLSNDPILRGLARRAGCAVLDASTSPASLPPGVSWIHDTRLHEATQYGDLHAWVSALQVIERDVFQPVLSAWQSGRISEVKLLAPSDKATLSASLSKAARWAFWRNPLSADALASRLQSANQN